ncbi:hypothetical protein HDU96_004411 [Phlyctochytrium bullatum]|nr:hypothetical protein HDU96_004411 [Phlyctochytrium bullatum]
MATVSTQASPSPTGAAPHAPPPRSHSMLPAHSPAPHIVIRGVTLFKRPSGASGSTADLHDHLSSEGTLCQSPSSTHPPSSPTASSVDAASPKSPNRPTIIGPDGVPTRIFPELILRNECAHLLAASSAGGNNRIRLVHWPTKTIRIFCGLNCPDLFTNRWRIIAISHTWGNAKPNLVDGVPWRVSLAEEKALEAAFDGSHPKDLHWLDVLSIHQESQSEKDYSTKEMSVVFARADAVSLWLPDTTSPWPLLGTIEPSEDAMTAMIRRLAGDTNLDPLLFPELRVNPSDPQPLSLTTLIGWLSDAFKDPWFARVWTTQEMALGKTLMFRGREFDLRHLRGWHAQLSHAHSYVSTETLDRLPLNELGVLGWHPTHHTWRNRIDSKFLDSSQDLRESVQDPSTGCTLSEVHASVTVRNCRYVRDKVLTMPPILNFDLAFPSFDSNDYSEELAENLWHHTVIKMAVYRDISVVYEIVPGYTSRDFGLWHPALNEGEWGRCPGFSRFRHGVGDLPLDSVKKKTNFLNALFKPHRAVTPNPLAIRTSRSLDTSRPSTSLARDQAACFPTPLQPGTYFIDDLPYDFCPPADAGTPDNRHPALLRNVHLIACDAVWKKSDARGSGDDTDIVQIACEKFGVSERERKRSEKMFARLHPQGLPRFYELTGGWHRGVAKVGKILAPFWMHKSFAPDPDEEPADAVWRTLKVMVVVPARPNFDGDARMRCWVVGRCGEEVPNSKINKFPGPYGAVWIDWDMVKKDLGLKNMKPTELAIP